MTKPDDLAGYAHGPGRRIQVVLRPEEARQVRAYRLAHHHRSDSAACAALVRAGLAALHPTTPTPEKEPK